MELSQRIVERSKSPMHRGAIFQVEADEKGLILVEAKESSLKIYLSVDPETDRILESKFFTYGGPSYTAIADVFCHLLENLSIEEATHITPQEIEALLRDDPDAPALTDGSPELGLIEPIKNIIGAEYPGRKEDAQNRQEIRKVHEEAGGKTAFEAKTDADKEWVALSKEEKITRIDKCLDDHVRAGLQMDGGDVKILDIENDVKVLVEYEGACGSCGAASGGTLFFMEDQVKRHVFHGLRVEPQGLFEGMM
jgi:NifU-like protein